MKLGYFSTHRREFVASHQIQKKVLSPLRQGAPRGLKRQNTLSLWVVFTVKLFRMFRLLTINFLVLCRFVSPFAVPFVLIVL